MLDVASTLVTFMLWRAARRISWLPNSSDEPRRHKKPFSRREKHQDQRSADCQVPQVTGWATEATPEAPARVVSGLAENTDSIFCDGHQWPEAANGCPVLRTAGTISREAQMRCDEP